MVISRKTGDFLAPGVVPRRRERTNRVDLYIVGLGIRGASQVTKETEGVLRRCRRVFSAAVFPQMNRYLRTICPDVIDLNFLRRQGEIRLKVYERMVEMVLEGAGESPPVALATYGHPLVYMAPSRWLLHRAPQCGLTVKMLAAVSSIDCLFVDLQLDPGPGGLQMYGANALLLRKRPLQPDVPCLILQPGSVETGLDSMNVGSRPKRFRRLKEYLLGFYPPTHEVIVATAPSALKGLPVQKGVTLGKLESAHTHLYQDATLYIPPRASRPVMDRKFESLLMSKEHLQNITAPPGAGKLS